MSATSLHFVFNKQLDSGLWWPIGAIVFLFLNIDLFYAFLFKYSNTNIYIFFHFLLFPIFFTIFLFIYFFNFFILF